MACVTILYLEVRLIMDMKIRGLVGNKKHCNKMMVKDLSNERF